MRLGSSQRPMMNWVVVSSIFYVHPWKWGKMHTHFHYIIFFRWVGEKHQPVKMYLMGVTFIRVRPHDIMEVTENSGQRYVWEKVFVWLLQWFAGLVFHSDLPKSATLLPRLGQGSIIALSPTWGHHVPHPRFSKPQGLAIAKKEAARFSRLAYEARMEWLNQPDWVDSRDDGGWWWSWWRRRWQRWTIPRWFKATSLSPSWRSLNLWKGHKELPGPYKLMCFFFKGCLNNLIFK